MDRVQDIGLDIASLQHRIDDLEFNRLYDLANIPMQHQLIALLKEQDSLKQILDKLIAIRKDDEDVLALMMCF
ncbi:MAG: hypothetical protein V4440_04725 [Pseudomonadota bacterium]